MVKGYFSEYDSMMVTAMVSHIGPSEVRALPVRHCRRAAWQTKWSLNSLSFSPLSSFLLSSTPYYFSPTRGCARNFSIQVLAISDNSKIKKKKLRTSSIFFFFLFSRSSKKKKLKNQNCLKWREL